MASKRKKVVGPVKQMIEHAAEAEARKMRATVAI